MALYCSLRIYLKCKFYVNKKAAVINYEDYMLMHDKTIATDIIKCSYNRRNLRKRFQNCIKMK